MLMNDISCDRGFSTINFIKNKFCSTMTSQYLNDLLSISLYEPSVETFDSIKIGEHWYITSKTTRYMKSYKHHKKLKANKDKW